MQSQEWVEGGPSAEKRAYLILSCGGKVSLYLLSIYSVLGALHTVLHLNQVTPQQVMWLLHPHFIEIFPPSHTVRTNCPPPPHTHLSSFKIVSCIAQAGLKLLFFLPQFLDVGIIGLCHHNSVLAAILTVLRSDDEGDLVRCQSIYL